MKPKKDMWIMPSKKKPWKTYRFRRHASSDRLPRLSNKAKLREKNWDAISVSVLLSISQSTSMLGKPKARLMAQAVALRTLLWNCKMYCPKTL